MTNNSQQMDRGYGIPPFVPRGGNSGGGARVSGYTQIVIKEPNTSEPKKAKRKRITQEQLKELTAVFEKTDTPTHDIREELSKNLGMTNREVQVWFQNRRAKYNRMRLEQQRQLRTNAAIIYNSGLMAGAAMPGRLSVPMPLPISAPAPVLAPVSPLHQQPPPAYLSSDVHRYHRASVVSPETPAAMLHPPSSPPGLYFPQHSAHSTSIPPTPTTAHHARQHDLARRFHYTGTPRAQTPPLDAAPMAYRPPPASPPNCSQIFHARPLHNARASESSETHADGEMHAPVGRRNTVSSYRVVSEAFDNSANVSTHSGLSVAVSTSSAQSTAPNAGNSASARLQYLPAVPGCNYRGRVSSPIRGYHHHSPAFPTANAGAPLAQSAGAEGSPASTHCSPPVGAGEADVKLPSIHAMLATADGSGNCQPRDASACSPSRMRAYTSPSPVPTSCMPRATGNGRTLLPQMPGMQLLKPPTVHRQAAACSLDSNNHHDKCHNSSPPLSDAQCLPTRFQYYAESQINDAKLGIDVLATAAISVSSAKSSNSLPHLTPLSEFSFKHSSQQYCATQAAPASPKQLPDQPLLTQGSDGARRSGLQSRKMTPVDGSRRVRSWRPW
ncbi:hypothetical protein H4R24_005538 [Coemansia sp. RSA 988]|nr:hypothetical protein H4R24_005538 [Coemansia sp. RSA 988]